LAQSHIAPPVLNPQAPYAEAWKRFDSLEQWAKNAAASEYAMYAVALVTGVLGRSDPRLSYPMMAVEVACGLTLAVIARRARSRFEHWPCPRCHSEWPGKKLEKEPRCAMCGLKLHQMTP